MVRSGVRAATTTNYAAGSLQKNFREPLPTAPLPYRPFWTPKKEQRYFTVVHGLTASFVCFFRFRYVVVFVCVLDVKKIYKNKCVLPQSGSEAG